jgi:hypothetical protein
MHQNMRKICKHVIAYFRVGGMFSLVRDLRDLSCKQQDTMSWKPQSREIVCLLFSDLNSIL